MRAFHFLEVPKPAFSCIAPRRAALLADSIKTVLIDLHAQPRTEPSDLTAPSLWAGNLPERVTTWVAWVLSVAAFGGRAGHERNRSQAQSDVCGVLHDWERHKVFGLKPRIPVHGHWLA